MNQEVLTNQSFFVVGIGASAGGLRALEEFFDNMSSDSGAAFVVIQHLSPDFKSLMKELLQRHTSMAVHRVTDGMELEANSVYLIPPGKNLVLKDHKLNLEKRSQNRELNFPIDIFFQSLAKTYGDRSIGVILSGSGSDGARGLSGINEAGGVALVQEPSTAEFDGMPRSAIATSIVNQILPPRELAQLVYQCIVSSLDVNNCNINRDNLVDTSGIKEITEILKEKEQLDFSHYKASTLSRRIHRRRLINNSENLEQYIELLRNTSEERTILCSDLLINVTYFFRDSQAWEILENKVIPSIIKNAAPDEELRFWVTACATGEEAYSLAMLVDEALQDLEKPVRVKIFATDIDKTALEKASQGLYSEAIIKDISPERLQKYFLVRDNSFQVVRKLREMLIFASQDLTKDAGFTRMHLITCRNVLIYMESYLQYQVLRGLHFFLINQGILFLGEAENLGQLEDEFKPLNKKWKIYQKRRDVRLPLLVRNPKRLTSSQFNYAPTPSNQFKIEPILEQTINLLLAESNAVVLLVNSERQLIQVCGDGSKILKIPDGKITNDVTKMVFPSWKTPLNTALYRVQKEKKQVFYTGIEIAGSANTFSLKIIPSPITNHHNNFYLIKIDQEQEKSTPLSEGEKFETNSHAESRILELEYELQQNRENLQTLIEELETTNEEQQASNEELIASNEELQSTNEELHSVNEELHTVNMEYQSKIQELIELNHDVENLLNSTDIGVIFLDSKLKIRKFTPAIKELIYIRDTDITRPLQELSSQIELSNFIQKIQQVLQHQQPIEQEVKLKNSEQYFLMRVHPYYVEKQKCDGIVVSFIRLDEVKKVQQELQETLTALTQSEARLYLALSAGDIGTWLWKPKENSLLWDNRLIDLYGIEPSLSPNTLQDWLNLVHPEDQQKVQQKILAATQGQESFGVEYRVIQPDGAIIYFSTKGKVYCNEKQECSHIAGVTIEVTEIREAEQALRQSEQRYRYLYNNTPVMLHSMDQEGKITNVSNYWLEYLGYEKKEVIGRKITEFLTKSQQVSSIICEVPSTPTSRLDLETEIIPEDCATTLCSAVPFEAVRKNGQVIEVLLSTITEQDESGAITNSMAVMIDVTERNKAERELSLLNQELEQRILERTIDLEAVNANLEQEICDRQKAQKALQKSEIYFRNTFEQAAVGLAHVDLEGKFCFLNQKFCQITGYPHDALINLTFQHITHPEDVGLVWQYFQETITGKRNSYTLEKRYIRPDGSIVWINLTVSIVRNEQNEPEYFISAIEDISERKAIAQALVQANQAKDTFISQMNHELRTPLNSILGFTQILQKDLALNEQQQQTLDLIATAGQYLLALINSILELSKIEAEKNILEQHDFSLSQLLEQVANSVRHRAETKGLVFQYYLDSSAPVVVKGDKIKLQQLLFNLLDNAVKFTDAGAITINVSSISKQESNTLSTQIRFQITDTGVGIAPEDMETIFEPFIHLEKDGTYREGTGLGLTISQKIAQLMGSQIQFKSELGKGTTCWFDLDLPEGDMTQLSDQSSVEVTFSYNNSGQCPKILITDDIAENRRLLVQYLNSHGFETAEATNGQQCLEIAENFHPDAILLDILMPEMDGIDTLKHLRQHPQLQNTVVIFISANPQFEAQFHTAKMKFEDFLVKPVNLQELSNSLQNHLSLSSTKTTAESVAVSITPPSPKQLKEILQLAEIGDIEAVLELASKSLKESDSQYSSFFQEIETLAREFKQNKLIKFLEKFDMV